MASSPLLAALVLVASSCFLAVSGQKFNAIYSFGDSMSDTGNLCVNGPPAGLTLTQPPYGETFFGRATCRCSDGRLVVDFLVRSAAADAVEEGQRGLQERREHGHHRRHHHGVQLLPVARRRRQDLEQRAPRHPDPVVPEPPPLRLRLLMQVVPVQVPVRAGRAGRERLQRAAVRRVHAGAGGGAGGHDRGRHRRRGGEAHRAGRHEHRDPRGAPRGVLPHLPHAVSDLQRRRLRPVRVPQAVQRAVVPPQLAAPGQGVQPSEQVPLRQDHVRRLLLPRLRHGQEPRQLRVQHEPEGVLRRRRGEVQLPERGEVRDVRRVGVRQPGVVAELGRDPPDGGGVQEDRRRLGQRAVLPPGHPVLETRSLLGLVQFASSKLGRRSIVHFN